MIAAVLVTHNSGDLISETLKSIAQQTKQPDLRIAIDDHSTDNTKSILSEHGFIVVDATTTRKDTTTRIAQNFVQGVKAAQELGATIVILGDHDDTWHPTRVDHQVLMLEQNPATALLASDGETTPGETLRTTFPVPSGFNNWDRKAQWRYTAKHSIATGGAAALVPANLSTIEVPDGWLHDRWWSLRAVHEGVMSVDTTRVINYRLSETQQVGLNTQGQHNPVSRIMNRLSNIPLTLKKMRDISTMLGNN